MEGEGVIFLVLLTHLTYSESEKRPMSVIHINCQPF